MLNEREILLRLLLGGDGITRSAATIFEERDQWREAVQLAFRWKALPDLNQKLSALGDSLRGEARNDLRELSARSFLRSAVVARRGAEAAETIASAGIPVAAFKGLAMLAVAGAERQSRTLQDVDLLVSEQDVVPAVRLLERRGYGCSVPGDLHDYFRFVRNSPGFSGNEAVVLAAPDGAEVDLHWRVGPRTAARFDSGVVLSRSRALPFKGRTIRVVGNVDGALLTVHHSLRNNFVPDDMVRDLLDLETWLTRMHSDDELTLFAEAARESALLSPALAMAGILSRVKPGDVTLRAIDVLQRGITPAMQSTAWKIEELFFFQLRDGPLNPDMLYLMRRDAWRLILSGALTGWSRYREQMQALEIKKHGAPLSLTRRFGRLWSSVIHTRRNHWALFRTLAQVKVS